MCYMCYSAGFMARSKTEEIVYCQHLIIWIIQYRFHYILHVLILQNNISYIFFCYFNLWSTYLIIGMGWCGVKLWNFSFCSQYARMNNMLTNYLTICMSTRSTVRCVTTFQRIHSIPRIMLNVFLSQILFTKQIFE